MIDRGERLLQAGEPGKALPVFLAAAKASPGNPSAWLRVADAAFLSGDAPRAARAAERAYALGGGDELLRRRIQSLLLACDEKSASRELAGKTGAEANFWRAALACRAARWTDARRLFLAAAGEDPARLAERAGLFAAWAGHRAASKGKAASFPGISIVGLGWKRPRQTTVGALDALAGCRRLVAVANTLDDATRDLLCLFRAPVTAVGFRGSEAEAERAARRALAAAASGPAGTVTRGNPLVYGRFAARLVALARAKGVPFRVLPGVSSYEGLAAEDRPAPGTPLGLEVRGAHDTAAHDGRAMVVFTPRSRVVAALPPRPARRIEGEGMLYYAPRMLALLLLAMPAAAEVPSFGPDARLELVGAVELAAGGRAKGFTDPKDGYAEAARERMKPFAEHPALQRQKALPKALDFVARIDVVDRLTADFTRTTSYFLPNQAMDLAPGAIEPWLEALSTLNRDSDFGAFFRTHRAELDARAEPFRKAAKDAKVLSAIEGYAGRPFDGTYEVRVSPYFDDEKMLNSVWPRAGGTRELDTIVGAGAGAANPEYYFKERLPAALWHQLAHGFLDAGVEAARADLAGRRDGRKEPCFGAWEQCVKENVARAVTARLLARHVSEKASARFLDDGDEKLFPKMPLLLARLKEYEVDRKRWPTLDAYLPRLFEVFPK